MFWSWLTDIINSQLVTTTHNAYLDSPNDFAERKHELLKNNLIVHNIKSNFHIIENKYHFCNQQNKEPSMILYDELRWKRTNRKWNYGQHIYSLQSYSLDTIRHIVIIFYVLIVAH